MKEVISGGVLVNELNQDSLVISMEAFAARLDPEDAVLDVLTRQIGGGIHSVGRMEAFFRERRLAIMSDRAGAAGAAIGATSIPVNNASSYHRDQIIMMPFTDDMAFVDEDVGGTAVAGHVKVRGRSGAGGLTYALSAGATILIGPESHAEGEEIPPAFANKDETIQYYNFQTDETIKISDIANAEEGYGMALIEKIRRDKMKEQLKRLGLAYYNSFGGRETVSSPGRRRHTMNGLKEWLEGQTTDASALPGGLTLQTIAAILRPTTTTGRSANMKVGVVGQNAWESICAMPLNALRESPGMSKDWGVTVNKLHTPYGSLPIVYDPLLSQENGMEGEMYILDKDHIKQTQLKGLPLVNRQNVQASRDIHNIEDVYSGSRGMKLELPELHRRVKGI